LNQNAHFDAVKPQIAIAHDFGSLVQIRPTGM